MPDHSRSLKSVATIVGATVILAGITTQSWATTVHITFFKSGDSVEGFGNLFYAGERYRLQIEGIAANSLKSSRSDLAGSVENMHAASDVLGAYGPMDSGDSTIVDDNRPVRIKNKNGVLLYMHGINFGKLPLDLAGMTVTSRGWGPDAKERARR